jgi:hypothetical protein
VQGAVWDATKDSGVWMLEQHYDLGSPALTDDDINRPGIEIQKDQIQFTPRAGHYEIPAGAVERPKPWPKPDDRRKP